MRRAAILAAFLLPAALAFVACGDDDDGEEVSLEEYFQNVEDIKADYDAEVEELDQQLNELEELDPDEQLDGLREFYSDSEAAFEQAIDDLDALEPPDEVEDRHDDFVGTGRDVLEESGNLFEELQDVDSVDEANDLFEDTPDIDKASQSFEDACRELQALADEEGVDANLGCGED